MEQEKKEEQVQEPVTKQENIDYEKINQHISAKIETEVGKFIKSFVELNKQNQGNSAENKVENDEERELKEWKI